MSIAYYSNGLAYPGGAPAVNDEVFVMVDGENEEATIFSDPNGLSPLEQPIATDGYGNIGFFAESGQYDIMVRGSKIDIYVGSPDGGSGGGVGLEQAVFLATGSGNVSAEQDLTLSPGVHPDHPVLPSFIVAGEGFQIKPGLYSFSANTVGRFNINDVPTDDSCEISGQLDGEREGFSNTLIRSSTEGYANALVQYESIQNELFFVEKLTNLKFYGWGSAATPFVPGGRVESLGERGGINSYLTIYDYFYGSYTIDWGDGSDIQSFDIVEEQEFEFPFHEYSEGTYTAELTGPNGWTLTIPNIVVIPDGISGEVFIDEGGGEQNSVFQVDVGSWYDNFYWKGILFTGILPVVGGFLDRTVTWKATYDEAEDTVDIDWGDGTTSGPLPLPLEKDHNYDDGSLLFVRIDENWSKQSLEAPIRWSTFDRCQNESEVDSYGQDPITEGTFDVSFAAAISRISPDVPNPEVGF